MLTPPLSCFTSISAFGSSTVRCQGLYSSHITPQKNDSIPISQTKVPSRCSDCQSVEMANSYVAEASLAKLAARL